MVMAGKTLDKKTENKADNAPVDDPDLRNQLAKRLAVAGGLVAILLGVLGLFDYFSQPSEETDLPVFTQPVPVAPRKMVTQPVTPADVLPDAPAPVAGAEPPAIPVAPAAPAAPAAESAPPPPVVAAAPVAEMPRATTSTAKPAARPAPSSSVVASPKAPVAVVPEMTSPPPMAPDMPRQTEVPQAAKTMPQKTARVLETTPPATAAPPRLFSGFVLQAGVFTSAQRAEELHARLTLSGVPSSIESRVQVGPFKTRQEAAAAQAKLRELGIETLLVPPTGSR
jgi:DedD protein